MFGFEMMFATTFSIPKFSVLQGPAIAAPAAAVPYDVVSTYYRPVISSRFFVSHL